LRSRRLGTKADPDQLRQGVGSLKAHRQSAVMRDAV
jgi:hypothetical protein